MVIFIGGSVWDGSETAKGHGKENVGKWAKRLCAFGEYGYMVFCVAMVSSRAYSREHLLDKYDFSELLNVKIFSLRTLLIDCLAGMEWRYIVGRERQLSQTEIDRVERQMQWNV